MVAVVLSVLSSILLVISYFLPSFETKREWCLSDYPLLMAMGATNFYVIPPICSLLSAIALSINAKWSKIIFGCLIILLGFIGCLGIPYLFSSIVMNLFFDTIVAVHLSSGFYLNVVAHICSVASGFALLSTPTTSVVGSPTSQSKESSKTVTSTKTSVRQRKNQKVSEKQKDVKTHTTTSKKTDNKKGNALIIIWSNAIITIGLLSLLFLSLTPQTNLNLTKMNLPSGFKIDIFANDVLGARSMAIGDKGTLFVGTRTEGNGRVYAIFDRNNDYKADEVRIIEEGLEMPNGVVYRNGSLYLAEVSRIWKYENIEQQLLSGTSSLKRELVRDNLPTDTHHGWKYLRFGPTDDLLYVPVGAPCNVCLKKDKRYATIMTIDVKKKFGDNESDRIFAEGVRNSVGFDFHPVTKELWITENGRDFASEEYPPDELNRVPKRGLHFGFPFCFGQNVADPETTNSSQNCNQYQKASRDLEPHVAAIGAQFYTGNMFPSVYKNSLFVCEHGSWNRKQPSGYKVMRANLGRDNSSIESYEPFLSGFIQEGIIKGRPVDVLTLKDGSLLVSDDYGHKIYRVTYQV